MSLPESQKAIIRRHWGKRNPSDIGGYCSPRLTSNEVREAAKALGLPDYKYSPSASWVLKEGSLHAPAMIEQGYVEVAPGVVMSRRSYELYQEALRS